MKFLKNITNFLFKVLCMFASPCPLLPPLSMKIYYATNTLCFFRAASTTNIFSGLLQGDELKKREGKKRIART